MEVRVEKKDQGKKRKEWTEQPTAALVSALVSGGSVWPTSAPFWMGKN